MSLYKTLEKLKKSEYLQIPEELLNSKFEGNEKAVRHANEAAALAREHSNKKLTDRDWDKLLESQNPLVIRAFVDNLDTDIQPEIAKKLLHTHISSGDTVYKKATESLSKEDPKSVKEFIKTAAPQALNRFVAKGKNLSAQHLFDAVTLRPEELERNVSHIVNHKNFDQSHVDEMYKHPNPDVSLSAIIAAKEKGWDINSKLDYLADHGSPEVQRGLIRNPYLLNSSHIGKLIQSPSDDIALRAAEEAKTPQQQEYVLNRFMQSHPEDALEAAKQWQNPTLKPEHWDALGNAVLVSDSNHSNFFTEHADKFSDEFGKKVIDMDSGYAPYFAQRPSMHQYALSKNNPHLTQSVLRNAQDPEIIKQAFRKATEQGLNPNKYLVNNKHTPSDVIENIWKNGLERGFGDPQIINDIGAHKNTPSHVIDHMLDIGLVKQAALAENPTQEQIIKGLQKDATDWAHVHFNKLTPENIDKLATNPKLHNKIIENNKTLPQTLEKIAQDPNITVSAIEKLALGNEKVKFLSKETQRSLYDKYKSTNGPDNAKNSLAVTRTLASLASRNPETMHDAFENYPIYHHLLMSDANGYLTPEHIQQIYNKYDRNVDLPTVARDIAAHPNTHPDTLNALLTNKNSDHSRRNAAAGIKNPEKLKELANSYDRMILEGLASNPHSSKEVISSLIDKPADYYPESFFDDTFFKNKNIDSEILGKMYDRFKNSHDVNGELVPNIIKHHSVPERVLHDASKHKNSYISESAQDKLSQLNPDSYNQSIGGTHIDIHPATEKLKHLKGKIEEHGGTIHKNQLPNKGQGIDGKFFDGKGNLTSQKIDEHLNSLPKERFNISFDEWDGAQMHDESVPQKVLQVNLTNAHVKKLKDEGLWGTFQKIHQMSKRSGHPVKNHTLGWVRIDESHPDHHHYDEFQSDLGQGLIRQIESAKNNNEMAPEVADKYIDHAKRMIKVLSGPFKSINHALFSAAHEYSRQAGVKSTGMDLIEDQAKQSGMSSDKKLPGHMIETYKNTPQDYGYEIKPKKEIMPNTKANETHVQYRKLVKSMAKLRDLLRNL